MVGVDDLSKKEEDHWNAILSQLIDNRSSQKRLAGAWDTLDPQESIVALVPLLISCCGGEPFSCPREI
jgi:hypothetical protein